MMDVALRRKATLTLAVVCLSLLTVSPLAAQDTGTEYRMPPPELTALVDAPRTPGVSLSPDRSTMLLLQPPSLPSIAEVSAPESRLAGLRINPRNNGPSRGTAYIGLRFRDLDGQEGWSWPRSETPGPTSTVPERHDRSRGTKPLSKS